MALYTSPKTGIKVDLTGLGPDQIIRVKSWADAGKGDRIKTEIKKWKDSGVLGGTKEDAPSDTQTTIDGQPGLNKAGADQEAKNLEAKDETVTNLGLAALGNVNSGPLDLSGAPGLANLDLSGVSKVQTVDDETRQRYENSIYSDLTRNNERNKGRDMEVMKQELANRGIPFDPGNTESLYGRSLQGIDERYQGYDEQARNQSITLGSQMMNQDITTANAAHNTEVSDLLTQFNADKTARDSFVTEALLGRSVPLDEAAKLFGMSSGEALINAFINKYATDKDFRAKIEAVNASKSSGRSSGGSDDNTPLIGGEAP